MSTNIAKTNKNFDISIWSYFGPQFSLQCSKQSISALSMTALFLEISTNISMACRSLKFGLLQLLFLRFGFVLRVSCCVSCFRRFGCVSWRGFRILLLERYFIKNAKPIFSKWNSDVRWLEQSFSELTFIRTFRNATKIHLKLKRNFSKTHTHAHTRALTHFTSNKMIYFYQDPNIMIPPPIIFM